MAISNLCEALEPRRMLAAQAPFDGPHVPDQRVEAEAFDVGGNGVSYFDTTAGNAGDSNVRPGEDVELYATTDYAGGSKVGQMQPGEWLEYTLDLARPGDFLVAVRLLNKRVDAGGLRVERVDGDALIRLADLAPVRGTDLNGDGQGNDGDFYTVRSLPVALAAGRVTLRFTATGAGGTAFNWFRLETPSPKGRGGVVNSNTLQGKVLVGYQGWFGTPASSDVVGFNHYGTGRRLAPDTVKVDFWPSVGEYKANAGEAGLTNSIPPTAATDFQNPDGSPAEVFDSASAATVRTHFEWMRDYGIDGVSLKRNAALFNDTPFSRETLRLRNLIVDAVKAESTRTGRVFAMHYDLSGSADGTISRVADDWEALVAGGLTSHGRYLKDGGRPVVSVFGVSNFDRRRDYQYDEVLQLVNRMKATGAKVIISPSHGWRGKLADDDGSGVTFEQVLMAADVVRPWTVNYAGNIVDVSRYATQLDADRVWLADRGKELQPVLYPGYSARNLQKNEKNRPDFENFYDSVPRRGGDFLWEQANAYDSVGARSAFVAMFDEMDEGTQILKVTPTPPQVADVPLLSYAADGVREDHYLHLTGKLTGVFQGANTMPAQPPRTTRTLGPLVSSGSSGPRQTLFPSIFSAVSLGRGEGTVFGKPDDLESR